MGETFLTKFMNEVVMKCKFSLNELHAENYLRANNTFLTALPSRHCTKNICKRFSEFPNSKSKIRLSKPGLLRFI